jgi:hypothetical protein
VSLLDLRAFALFGPKFGTSAFPWRTLIKSLVSGGMSGSTRQVSADPLAWCQYIFTRRMRRKAWKEFSCQMTELLRFSESQLFLPSDTFAEIRKDIHKRWQPPGDNRLTQRQSDGTINLVFDSSWQSQFFGFARQTIGL